MERNRLGFTLLEILVAVTIFSVIAVTLYTTFNSGVRVWRRSEASMELNQGVRLTLDLLAKELRCSLTIEKKDDVAKPVNEEQDVPLIEKPEMDFVGAVDSIEFLTLSVKRLEANNFRQEIAKVKYFRGENKSFVREISFQGQGFKPADDDKEVMFQGVEELKFQYSFANESEDLPPVWKDSWVGQEGIPKGVKLYLKVIGEEGAAGEFFKTVFIPTGILGEDKTDETSAK